METHGGNVEAEASVEVAAHCYGGQSGCGETQGNTGITSHLCFEMPVDAGVSCLARFAERAQGQASILFG
jgi:hypothetical protein